MAEPSTSTDTTTNRTFVTLRKKPLRNKKVFVMFCVFGVVIYSLVTASYYANMLIYVPGSASQQNQMHEDADRTELPTTKSVPDKKNTSARVLHDHLSLPTMEIMKANVTILPTNKSAPEKKYASAPLLQTMEFTEANMALEKKESIPNRVTHLMKKPAFQTIDAYSGMWWVSHPVSLPEPAS
jgi:hypothetical protein